MSSSKGQQRHRRRLVCPQLTAMWLNLMMNACLTQSTTISKPQTTTIMNGSQPSCLAATVYGLSSSTPALPAAPDDASSDVRAWA